MKEFCKDTQKLCETSKEPYEAPSVELIRFETADVIEDSLPGVVIIQN